MAGQLIIAGSGISAIAHLTMETIGYIQFADHVFYHATSGVMATKILSLNPKATDLYALYGEDKVRTKTYVQMCELMLNEVRAGKTVVGLFHGHPGFFVKSGRRALAIAQSENYPTYLIPGISTVDCLLSDLRIDPGFIGLQILKAGHVLRDEAVLATNNHLILLQINSVGDNRFSFSGYKHAKTGKLIEKLISIFGAEHESVYYVAPIFPGLSPTVRKRPLGDYRIPEVQASIGPGIMYLPPIGMSISAIVAKQAFDDEPYGQFEREAISELVGIRPDPKFKLRSASAAMMEVMEELGNNPIARIAYVSDPVGFVAKCSGLSTLETVALTRRDSEMLRAATTAPAGSVETPEKTFEEILTSAPAVRGTERVFPNEHKRSLSMRWTSEHQLMELGTQRFEHSGSTPTDPSHDLAHLMIGANGDLPWAPEGDRDVVKLAEFCAVFIEHLLSNIFNAHHGQADFATLNACTIAYGKWFVEHHFAPFPVSFDDAYQGLRTRLKPDVLGPLSLHFFRLKSAESSTPDYRSMEWWMSIDLSELPTAGSVTETSLLQSVQAQFALMQSER